MFRNKKVLEFSFPKTSKKLLNDKESIHRIKHLRSIIDNVSQKELKTFFRDHYSLIFSAFYDVFTNVQMELQQKVNSSHYKELQNILGVFEKILILLPDLIQKKWQFNCISSIIKTLIHPTNILKVRLQGLQLFTIWFQILGNNAPKLCYDIYTSLVPILESLIKKTLFQDANTDSQRIVSDASIPVNEIEIKPVLTQNIDKDLELEDEDQYLLRYLMRYIVTESIKIEWELNINEYRLNCQKFLFDKFKEYFLPVIFPKCSSDYTIDTNKEMKLVSYEFLENYSPAPNKYLIEGSKICCYQEEVIRWLAELVNLDHPNLDKSNNETVVKSLEILDESKRDTFSSIKSSNGQIKSTSIDVFVKFEKDSLKVEGPMLLQMHEILFKSEENINVINQLFQHALYLPLQYNKAHLSVIYVYKSWLFSNLYKNLVFMLEEDSSSPVKFKSVSSFNDSINGDKVNKISITMQKVIFTNIGTVFLHTYKPEVVNLRVSPLRKPHQNQKQLYSDLIRKIIALIFRRSLYNISNLEHEHLMNVLLDIGFNVLSCHSPANRPDNHWITNDALIGQFFQTLNFLILKSNLVTYISDDIWKRYLNVYSSLTEWDSVINEWKKTLYLLLKMLGKILYNVDMGDLPLEKKEKRGRRAKKTASSKPVKKLSNESDGIFPAIHGQDTSKDSYKNNTMTGIMNFNANTAFIEGLNQNTEDSVICAVEQRNNVNIKSESAKELNHGEFNKVIFCDNNEMDTVSFVYSSHEETSSYLSAEDSSSPHCKDKNIESNAGIHSDSECIPLSSSGGDTSIEGNCSFDNSLKQIYKDESEDLNIDADDESEGENIVNAQFEADSKTATLTRDESDVDLSSKFYRISTQDTVNDSSRTPTKHANRRKEKMHKRVERNSMNIEDNIVNVITESQDLSNQIFTSDDLNSHHVLLGGTIFGWNQESAVLLWKRFIGLLGNITHIKNPVILTSIFQYFLELTDSFIKMRENMCVPSGNQVTPSPPLFIPPIEYIIPWMFQAFKLDSSFDSVKLVALKILCKITIRKLDIEPSIDHLSQFYKMIHSIIHSENKVFIFTLISNIGFHFFLMPLAGSEILILDFIKACKFVLQVTNDPLSNSDDIPKLEAITLLGSMLKFQILSEHFKVFDSTSKSINIVDSGLYKGDILSILVNSAKQEPLIAPRSLSIICISFHCYSVLTSMETATSDLNDIPNCILLLLSLMRFDNMEIATISVDMIRFLVNSCGQMQEKLPLIPEKIIQVLSWTINQTWIKTRKSINSSHKIFLTTAIFALVDWTMHLPLSQLLESNDLHSKGLIYLAFSALENVLKDNDFNCGVKTSTSSLKQNPTDKKVVTETKRTSLKTPTVQQGNNYNGLSADPLIDYQSLFDVKSIQNYPEIEYEKDSGSNNFIELVKLAARVALCHLINNIGQYPKNNVLGGLSSCVQEHHDFQILKMKSSPDGSPENVVYDDLSQEVFNTSELQMFVVNGSMLVSFITLNTKPSKTFNQSAPGGPPITKPSMENYGQESEVRLIIRDLCGKYCWDVTFVHRYDNNNVIFKCNEERENMPPSPPPRRTLPTNPMNEKPANVKVQKQEKPVVDYVDRLLSDLMEKNPEIFSNQFPNPTSTDSGQQTLEALSKRQIQEQNNVENDLFDNHHCLKISHPKLVEKKLRSSVPYENPPEITTPNSRFYFCRQILTQLGFLSWKRRASIDLIQKTTILRDLKCIDQRRGRETHKIAVLYVAWGQEDKESILGNTTGSLEFNTFINGLGWKVSLENHKGFMGGLESSGRNGCFAPYFANSTLEVMFHVSTWMPSEKPEDKQNKFKHLGNDEVMVIWSENYRDYRSHITKTEFGDVMIIIHPLRNTFFGINIKAKSDAWTKFFGPLFDGAIVGEKELPVLVRATAVNAGRKIRECKQHYEEFFVERAKYLENAIKNFCEPMTFEDFAEHIYGIPTVNQDDSFQTNSPTEVSSDNNRNVGFTTNEYTSSLSNVDKGRDSIISVDWSSIRVNDTVRK